MTSPPVLVVDGLVRRFGSLTAVDDVSLRIEPGETVGLLGPNGAGKTTLISIICGIVNPTTGTVTADGHDIVRDYRAARYKIGLVPQELTADLFETVWATVNFSRGLFGRPKNTAYLEKLLRDLSLWDKRHDRLMTLSGGMKRRALIAKALSHEPDVSIPVMLPDRHTEVRLTRSEFEAMIRPALDETLVALRRTIASAHLPLKDVAAVLLVGGSSRIPLVAELVSAQSRPMCLPSFGLRHSRI